MGRPPKTPQDPFEQKPPKDKIKVKSKAYGYHLRAARGTVKPAVLNQKMEETRLRVLSTNRPAALIHNALKPFRENFKGGLFYQYLQKQFNVQAKKGVPFNLDKIMLDIELHDDIQAAAWVKSHTIDLNKNLPVSRIIALNVDIKIDRPSEGLHISVQYHANSTFLKRSRLYTHVQLTFIALYPDFADNMIDTESIVLPIRKITDKKVYSFTMQLPVTATGYLLFCKVESCENGVIKDYSPKAMELVRAENLD